MYINIFKLLTVQFLYDFRVMVLVQSVMCNVQGIQDYCQIEIKKIRTNNQTTSNSTNKYKKAKIQIK